MKKNNQIFLFMGPPGSGKGTLSSMCVKEFGWNQVSTGNLCRSHIQRNTDIGQKMKAALDQGQLVPDEIIADMISEWMLNQKEVKQNIIFDGYPRTKKQAEKLYALVKNDLKEFELMLVKFQVDAQVLKNRILDRIVCSNKDCQQAYSLANLASDAAMQCSLCDAALVRRSDDTVETLKHRLDLYYQHEQDIVDFYTDLGLSIDTIDATRSVQEVFNDFNKLAE